MRSPFTDRLRDAVPRSLRDLIATDPPQERDTRRRRRQRRTVTSRRVT